MSVRAWILRSTLGQCGFLSGHNISNRSQLTMKEKKKKKVIIGKRGGKLRL